MADGADFVGRKEVLETLLGMEGRVAAAEALVDTRVSHKDLMTHYNGLRAELLGRIDKSEERISESVSGALEKQALHFERHAAVEVKGLRDQVPGIVTAALSEEFEKREKAIEKRERAIEKAKEDVRTAEETVDRRVRWAIGLAVSSMALGAAGLIFGLWKSGIFGT
jgi:hypothetical protein